MLSRTSRTVAVYCGVMAICVGCKSTPPVKPELRIERVAQPNPGYKVGDPKITYGYVAHNGTAPLRWEFRDNWSTWTLTSDGAGASLTGEPLVGFAHEPPTFAVTVADATGQTASIDEKVTPANHPRVRALIRSRMWQGSYWLYEVSLDSAFSADAQRIKRHVLQAVVDTEMLIKHDRIQILDSANDDKPSDWHPVDPDGNATYTEFGTLDEGEWFGHSGADPSRIISTTVANGTFWVKIALKDGTRREIPDPKIECMIY